MATRRQIDTAAHGQRAAIVGGDTFGLDSATLTLLPPHERGAPFPWVTFRLAARARSVAEFHAWCAMLGIGGA